MKCLDIYVSALTHTEYKMIAQKIKIAKYKPHPLMGWDIVSMQRSTRSLSSDKMEDSKQLMELLLKNEWHFDTSLLLTTDYQAVVLTNAGQQIVWVNSGFEKMTGYVPSFALHKTPAFLQGPGTSDAVKEEIRTGLSAGQPFTSRIINYRKDGTEYLCQINVHPVRNINKEVTAFLAFETEIILGI